MPKNSGLLRALLGLCALTACGDANKPAAETSDATLETAADGSSSGSGSGGAAGTTDESPTTGTTGDPGEAQCQADLQDCPEGFKCLLRRGAEDWEFVCLPVQGDNGAGETCQHDGVIAGTDDCDADSWCIGAFDPTGAPWMGLCYPLCVGGECLDGERCVGVGALPVCAPICDPLIAGACGSDEACIFREPEGFVCFPPGAEGHKVGEVCETALSCEAGLHCAQKVVGCAPEDYCCTEYCDVEGDTNTCAAQDMGAECVAIGATDLSQAHVGACVIPE